jgi:hypothetical protein
LVRQNNVLFGSAYIFMYSNCYVYVSLLLYMFCSVYSV